MQTGTMSVLPFHSTVLAISLAMAGVAQASCPPLPDREARRSELMAQVRVAPDQRTAAELTNRLWEIWAEAPDRHSQELLDMGIERREIFDLENAIAAFDALIDYCPDYAEGYNQRAFVLFIRQDYAPALEDLDRALDRSPEHLGAMTGRAMTLMALDRNAEALAGLRAALDLNPWLKERDLVPVLEHRLGASEL